MKVDDIAAAYASQRVGLTVKLLEEEDGSLPTTVLLEGTPIALKMLAELLTAVANETGDDGYFISPKGAGRVHFSSEAQLGIYIHRKRS